MTSRQILQIGKQLLGIYFLVRGLMQLVGTLSMFGIDLPPGSRRVGLVAASALQGVIAVSAAIALLRGRLDGQASSESPLAKVRFEPPVLQLIGVYFLIEGLWALTRPAVATFLYSSAWQIQLAELLAALVAGSAGLFLILRPAPIARSLRRLRN
jgi:hypothetical protein